MKADILSRKDQVDTKEDNKDVKYYNLESVDRHLGLGLGP